MLRITFFTLCASLTVGCGTAASGGGAGSEAYAGDASTCPVTTDNGTLELGVDLEAGLHARIDVLRGATMVGESVQATAALSLPTGPYTLRPHRVRGTGASVGPAFQPQQSTLDVCVRAGMITKANVSYVREPGSQRLWLTQSNGSGAQVMAFDAAQLAALADQTPSVSLSTGLSNAGALAVDGQGRLWVASTTGTLAAYDMARLGTSSTDAPNILLEGPVVCEAVLPCGPNALAFDAQGNLWFSTISRVVKLNAANLNASGAPTAALTIQSPDAPAPRALAFDLTGNLWVADAGGAVVKFSSERLSSNITGAADLVIFAVQPGPVTIGLGGPESLVVDPDGNLWVGYFGAGGLVRLKPSELAHSASAESPLTPQLWLPLGVETLVTSLALDESGNVWLPGGPGDIYKIDRDQVSAMNPRISKLHSAELGTVEKLHFNTIAGRTFIAP